MDERLYWISVIFYFSIADFFNAGIRASAWFSMKRYCSPTPGLSPCKTGQASLAAGVANTV
jgi:hypothetical protein